MRYLVEDVFSVFFQIPAQNLCTFGRPGPAHKTKLTFRFYLPFLLGFFKSTRRSFKVSPWPSYLGGRLSLKGFPFFAFVLIFQKKFLSVLLSRIQFIFCPFFSFVFDFFFVLCFLFLICRFWISQVFVLSQPSLQEKVKTFGQPRAD